MGAIARKADHGCSAIAVIVATAALIKVIAGLRNVWAGVYIGRRDRVVAREIEVLGAASVRVALDDFGTGYASLIQLLNVPIDIIKIDQAFVDRLWPEDPSVVIVEGLIEIARRLGIEVVAVGIETQVQANQLCRWDANWVRASPSLTPPTGRQRLRCFVDTPLGQALRPDATVEGFAKRIVRWLSGSREVDLDAIVIGPLVEHLAGELGAIAPTEGLRRGH